MKKWICLLTLMTSPLFAMPTPPPKPIEPVTPVKTQMQKNKTAAAVVIATAIAITVGLLASGADTGKHAH